MKIAIAGGTGFIGEALTHYLLEREHTVYILTRNPLRKSTKKNLYYIEWLSPSSRPEKHLNGIDAFINFSGESLNSGRWTEQRKQRIIQSRIDTTDAVIKILSSLEAKPNVYINASAIGIYGTSLDETFTEDGTKFGSDFLAKTVRSWENEANKASELGIRTVFARLGVVLGKKGGALPRMVLPYRFFIGGTIGHGKQWLSWIHIQDVIKSIEFIIQNEKVSGAVNLVSPNPTQMRAFGQTIGKVLGRPHWIPVPGFALKILLGEMSILVLEGQKVLPETLKQTGYSFEFDNLEVALRDIL